MCLNKKWTKNYLRLNNMKIENKVTHNPKRKAVLWIFIPQPNNTRWVIWRQFDSLFVNHPFWATLQRKRWFGWKNVGEVREPFYFQYGETTDTFKTRVLKELIVA